MGGSSSLRGASYGGRSGGSEHHGFIDGISDLVSVYLIRYSALLIWVSFSKNPKYKVVGWAHGCLHIHLNSPRFSVPAVSDTNIDVVISHTSSSLSNQNARKNLNHWPSSQSLNCFTLLPNHKQDNIYVFRNSQI